MKLHRNVALVEVNDPGIIDALEATPDWRQLHLKRISPLAVAVMADRVEAVADRLRGLGFLPQIVER